MLNRAVPGITLEAPGSTVERTDRRPQAGDRSGEPLDLQHELGRRRERIEPAFHRRGPGVSRPASQLGPDPALPGDRLDHPGRRPQCFEDRPLLDVDLQVTEQSAGRIRRLIDPRRIEPERAKRVGHGDPGRVGPLEQSAIEPARGRQAAQKGSADSARLLPR